MEHRRKHRDGEVPLGPDNRQLLASWGGKAKGSPVRAELWRSHLEGDVRL